MQNISIIAKFLTIMAAFGLFALGVVTYSATQILKVDTSYRQLISGELVAAQKLIRANRAFQTARANITEMTITSSDAENKRVIDDLKASQATIAANFDIAIAALPSEARLVPLKSEVLRVLNEGCKPTVDRASVATSDVDNKASQDLFLSSCQPLFLAVTQKIATIADETAKTADDESRALAAVSNVTVVTTAASAVGGLVIVLLFGFFAIRTWMVTPIKSLAGVMRRLANADFTVDVGGTERKDEIGGMAKAVQVFKDNGLKAEKLAAESGNMRSEAEATRRRTEEADRLRAEAMAQATSGLGKGLKHLASGDLNFQLSYNDPTPSGVKPVWSVAPESVIVSPSPDDSLSADMPTKIWGWAWGDRQISSVEVSADGGNSWQNAILGPREDRSWQRFELPWIPASGRHLLLCRCINELGQGQPRSNARNAVHSVQIQVGDCAPLDSPTAR